MGLPRYAGKVAACNQPASSGTLVGVFEHFTDSARRVLVLSQEEARHLHDDSIGPEHLLLGMLREGDGVAAHALSDTGADYYRVREVIEEHDGLRDGRGSGPRPLSKATMKIIERSVGISWAQADGGIDTQHLLVALLEQQDETTEAVLAALDVTPHEVLQRVDAVLTDAVCWRTHYLFRRSPARWHSRSAATGASDSQCSKASCGVSITSVK